MKHILNIFLYLTIIILFIFFKINFLTYLLTLLINKKKIPNPYLFLIPKNVLYHLNYKSLIIYKN